MSIAEPAFQKVTFDASDRAFHDAVNARVEAYFARTGRSTKATPFVQFKVMLYLTALASSYGAVVFGGFGVPASIALCLLIGFLFATIGFNVGHDAIHGAFSEKPWVNALFSLSFDQMGASSLTWSIAHNFVHHTYTNIPGVDHDLDPGPVMKFTQTDKPAFVYRFQFLYAWVLYGLTTLVWLFKKDLTQILQPDPRTNKRAPARDVLRVVAAKTWYFAVYVAIPMVVMPVPWWYVVVGNIVAHAVAGLTLAVVFQLAHCVVGTTFPEASADRKMASGWAAHQMRTTANFGSSNRLLTFFVGGLDHQIEHHLFSKVSHAHYRALSPIVQTTALEFGLPYLQSPTFAGALLSHTRALYRFGRPAPRAPPTASLSTRSA